MVTQSLFTNAIVRPPAANLADGITSARLGSPDYAIACEQFECYCIALEASGLQLHRLPADARYPDSTFVEDTAIVTKECAIVTRLGATTRQGEEIDIAVALSQFYQTIYRIESPGTVDGGDVCEAENHFFIGVSSRTNESGARQLADLLEQHGHTTSLVDIRRGVPPELLHLKSGLACLGDNRLVLTEGLASSAEFDAYDRIVLAPGEEYAANCVRINETLLLAEGFSRFAESLRSLGHKIIPLAMSEFQKMDGGLSCLSLRF